MDEINAENIKSYFDQPITLKQIYNFVKMGVPLEPEPPKVISQTGKKEI